jgi:hypothetical protein
MGGGVVRRLGWEGVGGGTLYCGGESGGVCEGGAGVWGWW